MRTGTRIGSRRAEGRRRSARNRASVVDATWEKGETLGGKRIICRQERVGPVAVKPDNLENIKEAGGGAQGIQGSSKNCTSRERVCPLCRV